MGFEGFEGFEGLGFWSCGFMGLRVLELGRFEGLAFWSCGF